MRKKNVFLKLIDVDNYCFIEIDVKGKETSLYGFRDTRLNREELNLAKENGFYVYDLRTSDMDDSMPYSIEKDVFVNYYGTIITPIKIEELENQKDIVVEDYGLVEFEDDESFDKNLDKVFNSALIEEFDKETIPF